MNLIDIATSNDNIKILFDVIIKEYLKQNPKIKLLFEFILDVENTFLTTEDLLLINCNYIFCGRDYPISLTIRTIKDKYIIIIQHTHMNYTLYSPFVLDPDDVNEMDVRIQQLIMDNSKFNSNIMIDQTIIDNEYTREKLKHS